MKKNLSAKTSITINASDSKVWDALINPKKIKKYMFGADVTSEWKEESAINWNGEYEGKPYKDKGIIKKIDRWLCEYYGL